MTLRQQAYDLMADMPEESLRFVIEMLHGLRALSAATEDASLRKRRAFAEMEAMRKESHLYMPDGFDPERERLEALDEKYG